MKGLTMRIADLRHRLHLCRQEDVVLTGGTLQLNREVVLTVAAAVKEKAASTFSPTGAAMMDNRSARTHQVEFRYRPDINLSAMAWLYELRLKSPPRWFKILRVGHTENNAVPMYCVDCRLVERGDDLYVPATGPAVGLPAGVRL